MQEFMRHRNKRLPQACSWVRLAPLKECSSVTMLWQCVSIFESLSFACFFCFSLVFIIFIVMSYLLYLLESFGHMVL